MDCVATSPTLPTSTLADLRAAHGAWTTGSKKLYQIAAHLSLHRHTFPSFNLRLMSCQQLITKRRGITGKIGGLIGQKYAKRLPTVAKHPGGPTENDIGFSKKILSRIACKSFQNLALW